MRLHIALPTLAFTSLAAWGAVAARAVFSLEHVRAAVARARP